MLTRWNFTAAEAAVLALDDIHQTAVVQIHVGAGPGTRVDRRPVAGIVGIHDRTRLRGLLVLCSIYIPV